MNPETYRRKWRNFLIRKDIQLRLAVYNLLFLLLAIAVVIAMALIPLYTSFQDPENLWSQHFSAKFFIVIIDRLVLTFGIIFAIAFIFQIVITHRFAGPLINFSKTFHKISMGDLTRKISLRRTDFLHREASQVNDMAEALSKRIADIKIESDMLLLILENAYSTDSQGDQLRAKLREAVTQAGRCKANLAEFRIPSDIDTEIN